MTAGLVKLVALATAFGVGRADCDAPGPIRVTVVVVLASSHSAEVDPKLDELAKEVRKRAPGLTGFRAVAALQKSIPVGKSHTFDLPDRQKLEVAVDRPRDADGRVRLTVRPPGLGAITYACRCDKFFPVVTPHVTPAGDRLIVAVMAKPCTTK